MARCNCFDVGTGGWMRRGRLVLENFARFFCMGVSRKDIT